VNSRCPRRCLCHPRRRVDALREFCGLIGRGWTPQQMQTLRAAADAAMLPRGIW
jgi:hypothetical protein